MFLLFKGDVAMFNTSHTVDFSTGNKQSGSLYSKLETAVIASFNSAGKIKPLYFQYKDPYGDGNNIKIDRVLSCKEKNHDGHPVILYSCTAIVQDKRMQCSLLYHVPEHYWELVFN